MAEETPAHPHALYADIKLLAEPRGAILRRDHPGLHKGWKLHFRRPAREVDLGLHCQSERKSQAIRLEGRWQEDP